VPAPWDWRKGQRRRAEECVTKLGISRRLAAAAGEETAHLAGHGAIASRTDVTSDAHQEVPGAGATLLRKAMTDSAKMSFRSPATIWAALATFTYSACGHC